MQNRPWQDRVVLLILALSTAVSLVLLVAVLVDFENVGHPSWVNSRAIALPCSAALAGAYGAAFWKFGRTAWGTNLATVLAAVGVVGGFLTSGFVGGGSLFLLLLIVSRAASRRRTFSAHS